jgi:ABC-type nitrate/sulfonate/bicarbonate transport system permease component
MTEIFPIRIWRTLGAVLAIFAWLLAWEVASRTGLLDPFFAPPPSTLAATAWELVTEGFPGGITIQVHLVATLGRVVAGFLIAALLGIPIGIAVGYVPALDLVFGNIFTFGRSIAAISVLPLFVAWFGIGELSKISLISFAAFWVITTYTSASVKFIDPMLLRAALSMDAKGLTIFRSVVLPAALPKIFTGLKVGLGVAFLVIVAAEMIATEKGLGALVQEARTSFRTDITMVGMLTIGLLGYATSRVLDYCERKIMPWRAPSF